MTYSNAVQTVGNHSSSMLVQFAQLQYFISFLFLINCFIMDRTGVKVAIGASAVYVTFTEGVWSTSTEGSEAAKRLQNQILPDSSQYWEKVWSLLFCS